MLARITLTGNGTGLAAVALPVAGCGGAAAAHHAAKVPVNTARSAACGGGQARHCRHAQPATPGQAAPWSSLSMACPASR